MPTENKVRLFETNHSFIWSEFQIFFFCNAGKVYLVKILLFEDIFLLYAPQGMVQNKIHTEN